MNFVSYPDPRFASLRDVPVIQETFFNMLKNVLHIEFSTPSGSWVSLDENKNMLNVFSASFNAHPAVTPISLMQLKALPRALSWSDVTDKAARLKRNFFTIRECFFGLTLCLGADKKNLF